MSVIIHMIHLLYRSLKLKMSVSDHLMDMSKWLGNRLIGSHIMLVGGVYLGVYLILHTMHWCSILIYSSWCLDFTFTGFFSNIINGHSPVCHMFLTVAYQSQAKVYTIVGMTAVGIVISRLSDNMFKLCEPKECNKL